jgi:1-deoxy-D-xylulose-5-phosphate reductoisomerase
VNVLGEHRARALTILGATGSIGISTLQVAAHLGIPVFALTAHAKVEQLAAQARACNAQVAVVADEARHPELKRLLSGTGIRALAGASALNEVAADPATGAIVTAIVGAAGLEATITGVRAGKRVCIANKEPMVMAGDLIIAEAARSGAAILPVDSEHNAIFQCLEGHRQHEVAEILLTGSGGPFRTVHDLSTVTVEQALRHPTWSMGPKITVDSATLMNKSLEIIEARWLFGIEPERIRVLIHPQSVVHSMVSFSDGSVLAQLGRPDMRVPIQYALTWPHHVPGPVAAPDFTALGSLTFESPDTARFPSLGMAYAAARMGGLAPAVMNAANEMAVAAFLAGKATFLDIFRTVEDALGQVARGGPATLADIIAADADVRARLAR